MTNRQRLYYYPNSGRAKSRNPYVAKLKLGLGEEFDVVNGTSAARSGIFDAIFYVFRIDVFFCHWIEDIPDRKGGYIQAVFLLLLLRLMNAVNIKVVWVLHNKISHSKSNLWMKRKLVHALLVRSDKVLTHSSEGVEFAASLYPKSRRKIHFLHHPTENFTVGESRRDDLVCDVLVWGSMDPYKGIRELLEFVSQRPELRQVRFLIWGRFASGEYYKNCVQNASENIEIRNKFISEKELEDIQNASRIILFSYQDRSVLSSGALIRSLDSRATIIGPSSGNFRDLAEEGCIEVYRDLGGLAELIECAMTETGASQTVVNERARFCAENSWAHTSEKINQIVRDTVSGGR